MKRQILTFIGLMSCCVAFSQLPKWVIYPNYDSLTVKVDDTLLQTDSLGTTTLWTMDGKRLFQTEDYIHPFNDEVAVITKRGSDDLVGVVDRFGKFIPLPKSQVAYGYPYFKNGHLSFLTGDRYSYFKKDGSQAKLEKSVRSYPFNSGYAPFFTYDQFEKKKDPYYGYYRADGQEMKYRMLEKGVEKEIDPKNISFLSAIGENGRGVAVIKNKLYLFNPDTDVFEPFLYGDGDSEKKRHLVLNGDYERYFLNLPDDAISFTAKYGKNQEAILQFDNRLRPVRFIFDGDEQIFEEPKAAEFKYASEVSAYGESGLYGLSSKSQQALPQQFEEVGLRYANKAFVKSQGKWGVIEIIPDLTYKLSLNKGEDVAFRHQKFDTQIRLDLPARISAKDAKIDIPSSSGLIIDRTSRETKDTESGNYVVYDCTLIIPDSLPHTTTEITYSPVAISYDGIKLFDRPLDIKAWHYKYYNVDPIESETSISNGVATFTINIVADKNKGESDYPFELKIEADSVAIEYEKLSETRYKCLVSNLQDGNNNLNILITEKGCPPSIFPFEVYYTKPVPKKKTQEAVVIRKKSPQAPKPAARIEL